jgi:WD40 repeat protein
MVRYTFVMHSDKSRHSLRPEQLVVALSNGCIAIYELILNDTKAPQLRHLGNIPLFPQSSLLLSIAMNSTSGAVLTTLSTGEASIVDVKFGSTGASSVWKAHDLEVWCSAWKNSDTVMTGADDALLKLWDLRGDNSSPQMVCNRFKTLVV